MFAQDTWRIHPRLTASFGLRWEYTPLPDLLLTGTPSQSEVDNPYQDLTWPQRYRNLAPRVGVAFRPFSSGKTVVRGGFGLYYNSSLSVAADIVNGGPLNLSQFRSSSGIRSTYLLYGFQPDLRLPLVRQWSASIEHGFDNNNAIALTYVGTSGRDLLRRELDAANDEAFQYALVTNNG